MNGGEAEILFWPLQGRNPRLVVALARITLKDTVDDIPKGSNVVPFWVVDYNH